MANDRTPRHWSGIQVLQCPDLGWLTTYHITRLLRNGCTGLPRLVYLGSNVPYKAGARQLLGLFHMRHVLIE